MSGGHLPGHRSHASSGIWPWVVLLGVVLLVGVVVIFAAGESITGSDPGTIDSYNRDTLDSCDVPAGSTLVQASIRPVFDGEGQRYRSMWYVYASPAEAADASEFYGVALGASTFVSADRACRFGQRPSVLVLSADAAGAPIAIDPDTDRGAAAKVGYDGLWADQAADVTRIAEPPDDTRSFIRLRVAQRELSGIVG